MSHHSHHMDASRAACRNHTGTAQIIRDALARSPEPLSSYKLHLATGLKVEKIRAALADMVTRTGSVVATKGARGAVFYELYAQHQARKPKEQRAGSGKIAGRIVYPGYVYGASRIE